MTDSPDGASLLITRGIINLCHRESHEHPAVIEPGKAFRVSLPLKAIASSTSGNFLLPQLKARL